MKLINMQISLEFLKVVIILKKKNNKRTFRSGKRNYIATKTSFSDLIMFLSLFIKNQFHIDAYHYYTYTTHKQLDILNYNFIITCNILTICIFKLLFKIITYIVVNYISNIIRLGENSVLKMKHSFFSFILSCVIRSSLFEVV